MAAANPAGNLILKNLHAAVERLRDDMAKVEIWANALETFAHPVPDYDHGQSKFALRQASGARVGAVGIRDVSRD